MEDLELKDYILRQTGLKPYEPNSPMNIGYGVALPETEHAIHNHNQKIRADAFASQLTQTEIDDKYGVPGIVDTFSKPKDEDLKEHAITNQEHQAYFKSQPENAFWFSNENKPEEENPAEIANSLYQKEEINDIQSALNMTGTPNVLQKNLKKKIDEHENAELVKSYKHKTQLIENNVRGRSISRNLISTYFDNDIPEDLRQQLAERYGSAFEETSPQMQKLLKKLIIVDDLYSSSSDLSDLQSWNSVKSQVSPHNEEYLDELFISWYKKTGEKEISKDAELKKKHQTPTARKSLTTEGFFLEKGKSHTYNDVLKGFREDFLQKEVNDRLPKIANKYAEQFKQNLYEASDEERKLAIDQFKQFSNTLSPKYRKFVGTEYLPISEDDYLAFMAKYQADSMLGGEAYAAQNLQNTYNDIITSNTSGFENTCAAFNTAWVNMVISGGTIYRYPIAALLSAGDMTYDEALNFVDKSMAIMQYANTTNPWKAREAREAWEKGNAPINAAYTESSKEGDVWSSNTAYQLIGQSGYIGGFMVSGSIVGKSVGALAKMTSRGAASLGVTAGLISAENKTKALHNLVKGTQKASALAQTTIFASTNATLESSGVKYDFIQQRSLEKQNQLKADFESLLAQDIRNNPEAYASLYFNQTGVSLGTLVQKSNTSIEVGGPTFETQYNDKALQRMLLHFSQDEGLYGQYLQNKRSEYDNYMKLVESAADIGSNTAYALNMIPELVINSTLRKSLLPKSMLRGLKQVDSKIAEKVSIAFEKGQWTAKLVPYTKYMKFLEYGQRALGETVDELSESVFSAAGTKAAEEYLKGQTDERYKNYRLNCQTAALTADAVLAGISAVPGAMQDWETWYSGILGGMASEVGLPMINPNVNWSKRKSGESWINYAKRLNPIAWDSMLSLPFSDASIAEENKQRQAIADYVQTFLNDPAKQRLFDNAGHMASMMEKLNRATATGDQKLVDDAQFDVVESAVAHLSMLQGTEYYNMTTNLLANRAKLSKESLNDPNSEASKAVQEYYEEVGSNKALSKEEVLETIVNRANDMISMMEHAAREYADVTATYGEDIDPDFAHSIVKNRLLARDREMRMRDLQKSINTTLQSVDYKGSTRSKLSAEGKRHVAHFGTKYTRASDGTKIYTADEQLSELKNRAAQKIAEIEMRKDLSASKKRKLIREINKQLAKEEQRVSEFRQTIEGLSDSELTLSAEEILEMNPIDRALFLMREDHSKQQKQEINKLAKVKQQLITYGQLQADLNESRTIDSQIALDPKYLEEMQFEAKMKAKQEIVKSKYAYLADANLPYAEFRQKYFDAYNSISTQQELDVLLSIIKDSPHAEAFKAEREAFAKMYEQIHDSEKYGEVLKKKDQTERAYLDAMIYYLEESGLGINISDDINTIMSKLSQRDKNKFAKYLERQAGGEPIGSMPDEKMAQLLKSTYNSVTSDLEEIKKRNEAHQNVSSENVDNNPDVSVQPEAEEPKEEATSSPTPPTSTTPESKQTPEEETSEGRVDKPSESSNPTENAVSKKGDIKTATVEEILSEVDEQQVADDLKRQNAIIRPEDIKKVFNWFQNILFDYDSDETEETPWGYLQMKASAIKNNVLRAAVDKMMIALESKFSSNADSESDSTTDPVENAPIDISIEGHTGKTKEYLQKHRSYERLANATATKGSEVRFYTPQELIEEGKDTPVVAVIEDEKGHITIDGKKYGAVGTAPMTPTMRRENPKGKGDFIYSQKSLIDSFAKESLQPEHYEKDTPVVAAMGRTDSSLQTSAQAAAAFAKKAELRDNGKSLVYPIPRGRLNTTVDANVYVGKPAVVKSDGKQTIFEKAKSYQTVADDPSSTKDQKNQTAASFLTYNSLIRKAAKALGWKSKKKEKQLGLNKIAEMLHANPSAEVGEILDKMWNRINKSLSFDKHTRWTLAVKNVNKDSEGNLSFDVSLVGLGVEIPLTSVSKLAPGQDVPSSNFADVFANLMYAPAKEGETERKLIYKDAQERKGSWMTYRVWYTTDKGEKDTQSIREAAEDRILTANHKDFVPRPAELRVSLLRENTPFTEEPGISEMTDNSSPATPPTDTITTVEGTEVDKDTGLEVNPVPEPEDNLDDVSAEATTDEILEQERKNIEHTYDENFSLEDDDEGFSDGSENFDDEFGDEDIEFQLIKTRQTLIAKVRNYFSDLINSFEGKQAYQEVVEETKTLYGEYTKANAFSFKTERDRKNAKRKAEAKAKSIRDLKMPHVKSVSVVSNGSQGYSVSISYYDYPRYIRRRVESVETMTTEALRATSEAFHDTKKALNPTQKEAEKGRSFFSIFGTQSLKEQFNKKIAEPISKKLDGILTEVLSAYNIKVIEKDLREVHGKDVAGALNSVGDIIYLAKGGSRNAITLAEETAHVLVNNIVNGSNVDSRIRELYEDIAAEIESTSLYKETVEDYSSTYRNADTGEVDYERIKQEAIGKALAIAINNKYSKEDTLMNTIADFASSLISRARSFLEKSGITSGKEAVIQYKLDTLAKSLLDKDVKQVTKKSKTSLISSILNSLGIDTKTKHVKSDTELRMEEDKKRIMQRSSARTILYENLNQEVKEILDKKGITENSWKDFPMELQEQILKCLSKN